MKFRTRAIHVSQEPDPATGAVVPPIYLASTFAQHEAGVWRDFDYSRSGNPTRSTAANVLANLEGGAGCLLFASGMAATTCAVMTLSPGDHLIAGSDLYGGTYRLLHNVTSRFGIEVTLCDTTDLDAVRNAFRENTKILWLESPGNPLMSVTDLAACAEEAHRRGVLVAVDNTLASPALTRPIELGADLVMHSATKYLGGHSDVLGGALVSKTPELHKQLYTLLNATGAVMAPLESYLLVRGMRTLELRVREACRSAMVIAQALQRHPRVSRVCYPGLPSHPGHDVAAKQMTGGFGGMLSFEIDGTLDQAKAIVSGTKLFHLAVSLGAVESLISIPAAMSHASYAAADRIRFGITDGLIRLSVGLEDPDDLLTDLTAAIDRAFSGENVTG